MRDRRGKGAGGVGVAELRRGFVAAVAGSTRLTDNVQASGDWRQVTRQCRCKRHSGVEVPAAVVRETSHCV